MSEGDQDSLPGEDVFENVGQWFPPMNPPAEVLYDVGEWKNTGRVSAGDNVNWERIEEEEGPEDDPNSFQSLLATLEIVSPIQDFKRSAGLLENVPDPDRFLEEARKQWIDSEEFVANDQYRLPYVYYGRSVKIRFAKFSRGHKPRDFGEFVRRYVGVDRVVALGMLPLPNEWQMTLRDERDREVLLRQKKMMIGSRNVWVTPISRHEVRGMVHWLPLSVANASVAGALESDGIVLFVETLDPDTVVELRHPSKGVRYFALYLHRDKTPEDVPRMITVEGCRAFVSIPGRPPSCFHCKVEGHRKNECPIYNAMTDVHKNIPKSTARRSRRNKKGHVSDGSMSEVFTGNANATYKCDLNVLRQDYLRGTMRQGDLKRADRYGLEKASPGTLPEGDLETSDRSSGTTARGDLATAGEGHLEIIPGVDLRSESQNDEESERNSNLNTSGTDDVRTIDEGDLTADESLLDESKSVGVAIDKCVKDLAALGDIERDLTKLESELKYQLSDTVDDLNQKVERAYKIFHDLLNLK